MEQGDLRHAENQIVFGIRYKKEFAFHMVHIPAKNVRLRVAQARRFQTRCAVNMGLSEPSALT
jgi:hypothetical protein